MHSPSNQASTATPAHSMFYLKPAQWHWGRCLRAALCVGLPFAIGIYVHHIMFWMWIAMGTLMMTTGERPIPYAQRIPRLLCTSLLGAAGYLLGYLSLLPFGYTIAVMGCVGWIASIVSRRGPDWSIGCLQLLLTASIAIGVPSIQDFWWPAVLYLVGACLYALVLCVEGAVVVWLKRPVQVTHARLPATRTLPAFALALCLAAAYASKYFIDASHWFWVPLTVGLIMKPDLGNILDRSVLRCIGTAVGVLIASAILTLSPKDLWLALSIAVLAGVLPWCMARSYALQAVALTPLVLLLVDMIIPGVANVNDSLQRLVDTLIGASIVTVFGYSLWTLQVNVSSGSRARIS